MDSCDNPNCTVCNPGLACPRELKPGISRLNHTLMDHVDYSLPSGDCLGAVATMKKDSPRHRVVSGTAETAE